MFRFPEEPGQSQPFMRLDPCHRCKSAFSLSIPDLLCVNRFNRKHLIRFHLLHSLHKLLRLFASIEHHPVVQPSRAYLVASPHRLGHRFPSKQSIEFQVLQPKQLRVSVVPVTATHFNTFPGDKSHSTRQSTQPNLIKMRGTQTGTPLIFNTSTKLLRITLTSYHPRRHTLHQ